MASPVQPPVNERSWLPYLVLTIALASTAAAALFVERTARAKDQIRFDNSVRQVHETIVNHLNSNIDLLNGTRGLFELTNFVKPADFTKYVNNLHLRQDHPGVQGIGFSIVFSTSDADQVMRRVRELGIPDFHIWPETKSALISSIVYLVPQDELNKRAIGYDMFSEPTREAAMLRARDTGLPAATGRVELVQERAATQKQPGFLIYVPVYWGGGIPATREERRKLLQGFVYSPFRADDLLQAIFRKGQQPDVEIQLYAGEDLIADQLLHHSKHLAALPAGAEPQFKKSIAMDVAGQRWTLLLRAEPPFERASGKNLGLYVAIGGALLSFVLFGITRAQNNARVRAERNAEELRRAQKLIREAQIRYEAAFNQAAVGMSMITLDGHLTDVNQRLCDMLGYTREELLGKSSYEITHPDDVHPTRDINNALRAQTKSQAVIEKRYVKKDGTAVWAIASVALLLDTSGNPASLLAVQLDISDRKLAETQVRERTHALEVVNRVGRSLSGELELKKLVQAVTEAVTEISGAQFGAFFYNVLNEKGESYLLYTIAGVPPENFSKFPMPRNTAIFDPTFRGQGIVRSDDIMKDPRYGHSAPHFGQPQGHLPVHSYLAVPVISRNGEVIGGLFLGHENVGVFTAAAEESVAAIAAQASVAIDNARLYAAAREARESAEQANRVKDEFLATLSHELRTPINAILGWSQLLRSGSLSGQELQHGLETIERNSRTQAQLIEDLLDVSRIISGKLRLDVRPIDLTPVIESAIDAVRPAAKAREIEIVRSLDPNAGPVSADPDRVQQIVWNLLSNAIKFTPRGGKVQVRVQRNDSHAQIIVSDTGRGIEPAFLPYVFDRFRQADSTTTRQHGGLGLGLAIVRHLVELHGGTVRAESGGLDHGAIFTVELPIATEPEAGRGAPNGERQPALASDTLLASPPSLEGVKVLVVDDDADARGLIQTLLEKCRATTIPASDAMSAWNEVQRSRPDVLLGDIGMPNEDGYSMIRRIRALPPEQGGRTPAAALTAFARAEDRTAALLAGYQMHLAKPVNPTELIAVVANLAGRSL
jgi:PAS domain S-box-containing protein